MVAIVNKKILGYLQIIGGIGIIIDEISSFFLDIYQITNISNIGEFTIFVIVGLAFVLMGIDNVQQK